MTDTDQQTPVAGDTNTKVLQGERGASVSAKQSFIAGFVTETVSNHPSGKMAEVFCSQNHKYESQATKLHIAQIPNWSPRRRVGVSGNPPALCSLGSSAGASLASQKACGMNSLLHGFQFLAMFLVKHYKYILGQFKVESACAVIKNLCTAVRSI